MEELQGENN